jgi:cobalamin biosynthesis Co2+ chelatase CbiK
MELLTYLINLLHIQGEEMNVPSEVYYCAKEDNTMYEVSSIQIGKNVVTLKELKKKLVNANEWSKTSKVIFFKNGSRSEGLAYTTKLQECLKDNNFENPLYVEVHTTMNSGTLLFVFMAAYCDYKLIYSLCFRNGHTNRSGTNQKRKNIC